MDICTAAQMRRREQAAVDAGGSFEQLMENAGCAAAADLMRRVPEAGRVLVVCGKGNNGGDGLVVARILHEAGWQADVVLLAGRALSPLAQSNLQRLEHLDAVRIMDAQALAALPADGYAVVVDAVFGTGFGGRLPENVAAACRLLNGFSGLKAALDIPTGLDCDKGSADKDAFCADVCYAFAALKPAHVGAAQRLCGETVCLDIGI